MMTKDNKLPAVAKYDREWETAARQMLAALRQAQPYVEAAAAHDAELLGEDDDMIVNGSAEDLAEIRAAIKRAEDAGIKEELPR